MSKKEDRLWAEGFDTACRIAEERGLEGLMAEKRFRGVTGVKCRITSTDLDTMGEEIKTIMFQTIRIAFCSVLHDKFGFGKKRISQLFDGIDKLAAYMDHGWIYWMDLIVEIQKRIGKDLSFAFDNENFRVWQRPEDQDFYDEADFIEKEAWDARIKFLGLTDDGKQVKDRTGLWCWKYGDEYNKVRIYDELGGIILSVNYLGAKKPGDDVTLDELKAAANSSKTNISPAPPAPKEPGKQERRKKKRKRRM